MKRPLFVAAVAALCVWSAGPSAAADDLNAFRTLQGSEVRFSLSGAYSNATLTVVGPDGFVARDFSETGSPAIDLIRAEAKADGIYKYEVTAATSERLKIDPNENNGRGAGARAPLRGVTASGTFVVENGLIVDLPEEEE